MTSNMFLEEPHLSEIELVYYRYIHNMRGKSIHCTLPVGDRRDNKDSKIALLTNVSYISTLPASIQTLLFLVKKAAFLAMYFNNIQSATQSFPHVQTEQEQSNCSLVAKRL